MRILILAILLTGCSTEIKLPDRDNVPLSQYRIEQIIKAFDESSRHAADMARRIESVELR